MVELRGDACQCGERPPLPATCRRRIKERTERLFDRLKDATCCTMPFLFDCERALTDHRKDSRTKSNVLDSRTAGRWQSQVNGGGGDELQFLRGSFGGCGYGLPFLRGDQCPMFHRKNQVQLKSRPIFPSIIEANFKRFGTPAKITRENGTGRRFFWVRSGLSAKDCGRPSSFTWWRSSSRLAFRCWDTPSSMVCAETTCITRN